MSFMVEHPKPRAAHPAPEGAAAPRKSRRIRTTAGVTRSAGHVPPADPSGQPAAPKTTAGTTTRSANTSKSLGLAASFGQYVSRTVADAVHSGSGRTAANDDNTDYYPVPLTAETSAPGVRYTPTHTGTF